MILKSMQFVVQVLNDYLKNTFKISEDAVVLNKIVELDGSVSPYIQNKIVFTLVHLEEDVFRNQELSKSTENHLKYDKKKYYFVYVALTSNLNDYAQSLKFLDVSLAFLNENPTFNSITNATFPEQLELINCILHSVSFDQNLKLINVLQLKNTPFVILKLTIISK
jgi:hypothetical protein